MRDQRGALRSRLLALWLFLGSIVLGVILLPLLVLGPSLLPRTFPKSVRSTASTVIHASYYPVVIVLLLLSLTSLYHLAPPRRLPWRRGAPGAVLAMAVFLGGSAGLRSYITFILNHNHAYGTLAAPIAALLFFYILGLGVLLGAEFNAALEQLAPTPVRPPRVLDPRGWRSLDDVDRADDQSSDEPQPDRQSSDEPPGGKDS
jgi:membrane protein